MALKHFRVVCVFRGSKRLGREVATELRAVHSQSAGGLAQSKTLRAVRMSSEFAPASWTAAALRRF
jgi:hypothetical protein